MGKEQLPSSRECSYDMSLRGWVDKSVRHRMRGFGSLASLGRPRYTVNQNGNMQASSLDARSHSNDRGNTGTSIMTNAGQTLAITSAATCAEVRYRANLQTPVRCCRESCGKRVDE